MVSPHVTLISEEIPSLFFVPESIDSVFPKWMDSLLSTNHPFREQGQGRKFIAKLLLNFVDILARN